MEFNRAVKAASVLPATLEACGGIEDRYDAARIAGDVQDG